MERADWAPVAVGVVQLVEVPRSCRTVDFGSLRTNGPAVLVHATLFFTLYALTVLVLRLHIYA